MSRSEWDRPPHRSSNTRRGFTLVEVLLALALSILVLAAAYSGLTLFRKVTVAGRTDAERSQLARAIERRVAADIRCVLFRETEPEAEEEEPAAGLEIQGQGGAAEDTGEFTTGSGSGSSGGGAGASSGGSSTGGSASGGSTSGGSSTSGSTSEDPATPTTPADAYASQSVGVFGDATTLVLHVAKPLRENAAPAATPAATTATEAPLAPRKSDLRSISYFLAVPGGEGLQSAVANAAAGGLVNSPEAGKNQGLARLDGDRLAIQQADAAGSVDLLAQQATIVAEEVTELSFRYFDGAAWVTEWDSVALNALPRAIEVTFRVEVDRSDVPTNSFLAAPPPSASDLYRFVVALPLADPTLVLAL